jgi:hypothetical protein
MNLFLLWITMWRSLLISPEEAGYKHGKSQGQLGADGWRQPAFICDVDKAVSKAG